MTNGKTPEDGTTVASGPTDEVTTLAGTTFVSPPHHHKPDEETTITPRPAADRTTADGTSASPDTSHDPSPDPETIDPATVEAVSLEEAGLQHKEKAAESTGSRAAGVLLIVLLALIAAGAGAALGPLIHGTPSSGGADPATIAALDQRVASLEQSVGGLAPLADKVAALEQRAAALDGRVAAAEAAPAAGNDASAADLLDRIDSLERAVTALATRVDGSLDQKLAAIDGRLAGLEGGGGTTGEAQPDDSLAAEIAALEQKVADLGSQLSSAADTEQLAALTAGLDTLKGEVETLQSRATDPRAAFALAVGQLRETVLAGNGYADTLDAARALEPDDAAAKAALQTLAAWQETGVATRARLAEALNAAAYQAVDAARRDNAESWFDKTVAELASIVSIRRVDGATGSGSADDVTARAEARLREGDLGGAIDEMASLTGAAGAAAAGWLETARARQSAEQALDTLSARAIALIGGAAG